MSVEHLKQVGTREARTCAYRELDRVMVSLEPNLIAPQVGILRGVEYDPSVVSVLVSDILASRVSREMSFRLGQALELTDALWDLVPVLVSSMTGAPCRDG